MRSKRRRISGRRIENRLRGAVAIAVASCDQPMRADERTLLKCGRELRELANEQRSIGGVVERVGERTVEP